MTSFPKDRLSLLRNKIEQQRQTVDALKAGGHPCPDAERQLQQMTAELRAGERAARQSSSSGVGGSESQPPTPPAA